ncbi:MAG: hypothetical protein COT84_01570 [Chlamydiae bacterium CG10_big_fil_rev_8_21_14_0_10_35_9]|nr:MAG: hypothetical protein COT84_01570 [Chlamydiae bacterium CG10_big_fil_rev_8_21_14_0_10_35_9]
MKTCTFIANSRHAYFNLPSLPSEGWNFELIIEEPYEVSSDFAALMTQIHRVKKIDFDTCHPIICKTTKAIVCCDEKLLLTAAQLRKSLNIPGARPSQYFPFSSKRIMKEILSCIPLKIPSFVDFDSRFSLEELHANFSRLFPNGYIVKPLDSGASMNVAKIKCFQELETWYDHAFNRAEEYTAEELIEGDMYFCDSFVLDGKIQFSTVSKYLYPCLDFVNGRPLGAYPVEQEAVSRFNQKIIDTLAPPDGALHMECIEQDGELFFIEIGARPPGKSAVACHEKNFGINLYECTLRNELGLPIDFTIKTNLYHSWVVLSTYPGVVHQLNPPALKSHHKIHWKIQKGDTIASYPPHINAGYSAFLELYNKDYKELLEDLEYLKTHKPYLDWGSVSEEYALFRPPPPSSFFERLQKVGIGLPNQRILDLGTGTGFLARQFALQKAIVTGIDISEKQIQMAKSLSESLPIEYLASPAENISFPDAHFDVITAMQCWPYFNQETLLPILEKILKPNGILMIGNFDHLSKQSKVASMTEELILKYNPNWTQAGYSGELSPPTNITVQKMFYYDEEIAFTANSWIQRIVASQAIGTILSFQKIQDFKEELSVLLKPFPSFTIPHRLSAYISSFKTT